MVAVSVVMPLRDAQEWLDACLDSIQRQSLDDFELLVVDDHSTDAGPRMVLQRARDDGRLRLLRNPGHGLVSALNHGLSAARGALVARMDADDQMHARRLEAQVAALEAAPGTTLLACRVRAFPEPALTHGMREYLRWQDRCVTPESIAARIYQEAPFVHPSVMFRRHAIIDIGGYREGDFPEDYDLWLRLARAAGVMAKLPEVLLDWRLHAASLSRTDPRYARDAFDILRTSYLCEDARLAGPRPVVVWGAGRRTRQRARRLRDAGVEFAAFIDIDPRKVGNRVEGVAVYPPDWLAHRSDGDGRPFVLVYVASHGAREAIDGALHGMGFREGQDFLHVG